MGKGRLAARFATSRLEPTLEGMARADRLAAEWELGGA